MSKCTSNKTSGPEISPGIYINPDGTYIMVLPNGEGYEFSNLNDLVEHINSLYNKGEFQKALPFIKYAFEFAKVIDQSSEDFRKTLTKLYGLAGDTYAEYGNVQSALEYYKSFQCLKMQLKTNLFRDTQPSENIKLYQFRKFSKYALANLLNHEITLSSPKIMNDVFDSLVYQWLNSPSYGETVLYKKHLAPYHESFNDYRIACFCEDNSEKNQIAIQNNLMWSHYADEHRGFCVEYLFNSDDFRRDEFDKTSASRLFRMQYWNTAEKPLDFTDLLSHNKLTTTEAFLTKHNHWAYENEIRLLQFSPNNGAEHVQYKLSDRTKVSAIYFGFRCPPENIEIIKKRLVGSDIKFFKMEIDYSNIYQFKIEEI